MAEAASESSPPWQLVAILSVDKTERVQCQCNGCGQGIYAAIHMVIHASGEIECWGSECYAKKADSAGIPAMKPIYAGASRRLTALERELLRNNREQLIERFKIEFDVEQRCQNEARRAEEALRAELNDRRRATQRRLADELNSAPTHSAAPAVPSESMRWAYDLSPRTCVLCGNVTSEWWTNVGPDGCKCKACLKAGRT